MTPQRFLSLGIDPALTLLPKPMTSPEARAMVMAIAFQESHILERRQHPTGPARSFLQFEMTGIAGVLVHRASRGHATRLCEALEIEDDVATVYRAIEFNDVLAAGFARLLLWTTPDRMPGKHEPDRAWSIYLKAWRPGKPRPSDWIDSYAVGWKTVEVTG